MTDPKMIMTEAHTTYLDFFTAHKRQRVILGLLLIGLLAIIISPKNQLDAEWRAIYRGEILKGETFPTPVAEEEPVILPLPTFDVNATAIAPEEIDPYAKYEGQVVPHPRRNPDALVIIKISRYDPALGGPNCFTWSWSQNTCLSNLSNGEDWRVNYEIALACDQSWPYYTVVEIDGQLWWCKDHGGKIVQSRPGVYWVDQLSRTGHYPHGFEMEASVWFPPN